MNKMESWFLLHYSQIFVSQFLILKIFDDFNQWQITQARVLIRNWRELTYSSSILHSSLINYGCQAVAWRRFPKLLKFRLKLDLRWPIYSDMLVVSQHSLGSWIAFNITDSIRLSIVSRLPCVHHVYLLMVPIKVTKRPSYHNYIILLEIEQRSRFSMSKLKCTCIFFFLYFHLWPNRIWLLENSSSHLKENDILI